MAYGAGGILESLSIFSFLSKYLAFCLFIMIGFIMWTELKYTKAIVTGVENFIEKLNNEVNNSFSNGLGGIGVLA